MFTNARNPFQWFKIFKLTNQNAFQRDLAIWALVTNPRYEIGKSGMQG